MLIYLIQAHIKDMRGSALRHNCKYFFISIALITILLCACPAESAEVLIIGDSKLKPVSELITGIEEALSYTSTVKAPADVKDNLESVYYREGAKAVVALGQDAVNASLALPESIPVIYGLIINPPETTRKNITGVYMATPVSEYMSFINKYFPGIKQIGIICEPKTKELLCSTAGPANVTFYHATNPYEFITAVGELRNNVDALLLLPEKNLLSQTAIEKAYLFSFRDKIPVIGISEKYVKTGSLFSLGFDPSDMEKQLGNLTMKVLLRGTASGIPQSPPEKFTLYINKKTAETTGIRVPQELINMAERVYP
jgi:putative ABC transport system substrate-binding protein